MVERLRLVTVEYSVIPNGDEEVIKSSSEAVRVLRHLIGKRDRECFVVLHLDARNQVIAAEFVSIGTTSQSLVHPREVFKGALYANASGIICGHNHPSGDVTPSSEDHAILERLRAASELLGIPMLDFLVVGPRPRWWSAKDVGKV